MDILSVLLVWSNIFVNVASEDVFPYDAPGEKILSGATIPHIILLWYPPMQHSRHSTDIWSCGLCWIDGWHVHVCLTDFDNHMDHFKVLCLKNEIMFKSCEEFDNFVENQPISFDQRATYKRFSCRFVESWTLLHTSQNNAICLKEWEILLCCEIQNNCSEIWALF